jgi:methylated-DNA-[protein]-cysteine S-methyltransferase
MPSEGSVEPVRTMSERESDTRAWDLYESPIGTLTLEAGPRGLSALHFPGRGHPPGRRTRGVGILSAAVSQLEEYFAGERRSFELELDLRGTGLQLDVWRELVAIPYGTTVSYSDLAGRVGRPDIARAVGAAVGQTPVPIVVPCHRVIGKDGSLTGYGGGLGRKQALLELEHETAGAPPASSAFRQPALL